MAQWLWRRRFLYFYNKFSLCYFVIIFPWKRTGSFIWRKLNSLHQRMLCVKFGWNWPISSGEEDILLLYPLGKGLDPSFIKTWIPPFNQECFVPSLVDICRVILEKIVFLLFRCYLLLQRGRALHLNNLESLHLKDPSSLVGIGSWEKIFQFENVKS